MVRSHRRPVSVLGRLVGLLLLGVSMAMVAAGGVLAGLTVLSKTEALLAVFMPGIAVAAIGAALWWLARSRQAATGATARPRADAGLAILYPTLICNGTYVGVGAVHDANADDRDWLAARP